MEHDEHLQSRLRELSEQGRSAELADLTERAWDAVYVFSEGVSAERVERAVGTAVLSDDFYYEAGNLLVFERSGEVTAAVPVLPDLLVTGGRSRWGPDVRLEPQRAQARRVAAGPAGERRSGDNAEAYATGIAEPALLTGIHSGPRRYEQRNTPPYG